MVLLAQGIDGSDGNQPRGTQVIGNLCHEYGYNQKQSSCVFMAKSMQTNITGNIMMNAARAHINQNVRHTDLRTQGTDRLSHRQPLVKM